mgnify:CR=1 FL=1
MSVWKRNVLFLAALLAIFLAVAYSVSGLFLPASAVSRRVIVEIPPGANAAAIGARLERQGVIRSRHAFVLLVRGMGYAHQLQAGEYELDPSHGLYEILEKIASGEAISHWITIPEGFTLRQIAQQIERAGLGNALRFHELATHGSGRFDPGAEIPLPTLEGYLFPDTYKLPTGATEEAILRAMVDNFRAKVTEPLGEEIRRSGRTLHEIVIVASMIEREARVPEDRPKIAAVIYNRLRRGMRLQIDATVLYAIGRTRFTNFAVESGVDSRYNTYRYAGLPPGPICNPGLASIRAALAPAPVDFLYYVADPATGAHLFARTHEEHLANRRKVERRAAD